MADEIENSGPAKSDDASPRGQFRKFARTSIGFTAGFLLATLALNAIIGAYLHHAHRRGGLGPEVQLAMERTEKESNAVRIIFLGDSVSRQLFHPNTEPSSAVRFLTTNQAITMAGQCYLAEDAFKRCPKITDVYLFYLPGAWLNNLPREFTHDYLCGHFHTAAEVVEVFKVKRDIELTLAHAGRWLWPNIMAANSLSRPAFSLQPEAREQPLNTAAGLAVPPPDPERLLTAISSLMEPPAVVFPPMPPGQRAVLLSAESRYYLEKLRNDCQSRGIRLHVLPCPVSDEKNHVQFVDVDHVYDGPIIGDVPAEQLIDAVHLKSPFVKPMRDRVTRFYRLDFLQAGSAAK